MTNLHQKILIVYWSSFVMSTIYPNTYVSSGINSSTSTIIALYIMVSVIPLEYLKY